MMDALSAKVFKYPDIKPQFFSYGTQREALKKFEEDVNVFRLFSFEVSVGGSRRYIVCPVEVFWTKYQVVTKRNFYEVICNKVPSKLYCDLEFEKLNNEDKDGYEMTRSLQNAIFRKLKTDHGISVNQDDCLVLESSNCTKFSIHLVFFTVVFKTNKDCGLFMQQVLSDLPESTYEVYKEAPKGKSGKIVKSFVDLTVYSSVQQFRLFESSKFGQSRPFKVSVFDTSTEDLRKKESLDVGDIRLQKEVFLRSLITHTKHEEENIISIRSPGLEYRHDQTKKEDLYIREINLKFATSFVRNSGNHVQVISGDGGVRNSNLEVGQSNLRRIEIFLSQYVHPGQIWKKTLYGDEIITFNVKNYTFCEKAGRDHSSKKQIYFIYNKRKLRLEQGCFSNGCKHIVNKLISVKF